MRIMEIRGFPGSKIQLTDLGWLIKNRVAKELIFWPDQAVCGGISKAWRFRSSDINRKMLVKNAWQVKRRKR